MADWARFDERKKEKEKERKKQRKEERKAKENKEGRKERKKERKKERRGFLSMRTNNSHKPLLFCDGTLQNNTRLYFECRSGFFVDCRLERISLKGDDDVIGPIGAGVGSDASL